MASVWMILLSQWTEDIRHRQHLVNRFRVAVARRWNVCVCQRNCWDGWGGRGVFSWCQRKVRPPHPSPHALLQKISGGGKLSQHERTCVDIMHFLLSSKAHCCCWGFFSSRAAAHYSATGPAQTSRYNTYTTTLTMQASFSLSTYIYLYSGTELITELLTRLLPVLDCVFELRLWLHHRAGGERLQPDSVTPISWNNLHLRWRENGFWNTAATVLNHYWTQLSKN